MSKIVLTDMNSGYNLAAINDNFQKIADELNNKVLYRVNPVGEPNQMINTNLDMNQNDIINVGSLSAAEVIVAGTDVGNIAVQAATSAQAAAVSATASSQSALASQEALGEIMTLVPPFQVADYAGLRAYTGSANSVQVIGFSINGPIPIAGTFTYTPSDTTSLDDGGIIIVDVTSRRWKRVFTTDITPMWYGAAGTGLSDDTSAVIKADLAATSMGRPLLLDRAYLISGNTTLNSAIKWDGGKFIWTSGILTLNGKLSIPREAIAFNYTPAATLIVSETTVSTGWMDVKRDASEDVSFFIQQMINGAPLWGRKIEVPTGRFGIATPISFSIGSYIAISGDNQGERSGIEYAKPSPDNYGSNQEFPQGGSALCCMKTCTGVFDTTSYPSPYNDGNFRISGITIEKLSIVGSSNATVTQNGIRHYVPTDGMIIADCNIGNFNGTNLMIDNSDAITIRNNWCAESKNALQLGVSGLAVSGNVQSTITGNYFGGQAAGVTVDLGNFGHMVLCSNRFDDGGIQLRFGNGAAFAIVSGNSFRCYYTGQIQFQGNAAAIQFSNNSLRVAKHTGAWPVDTPTSDDPLGRDILYGVIYVNAGNDIVISNINFDSDMPATGQQTSQPQGYCGIRIRVGKGRVNNFNFSGSASTFKMAVEGSYSGTIKDCTLSTETVATAGTGTVAISYLTV